MAVFAREHRLPFPYLHDVTQTVARAYDAACTPDFYGFDAELRLQYRGRLDDSGRDPQAGKPPRALRGHAPGRRDRRRARASRCRPSAARSSGRPHDQRPAFADGPHRLRPRRDARPFDPDPRRRRQRAPRRARPRRRSTPATVSRLRRPRRRARSSSACSRHTGGVPGERHRAARSRASARSTRDDPLTGTDPLSPACAEALAALAAAGHGLAVCTQKPNGPALAILRGRALMPPITGFTGGDSLPGVLKPDPRMVSHAADQLAPGPLVYVGDSETDAATAAAAGVALPALHRGLPPRRRSRRCRTRQPSPTMPSFPASSPRPARSRSAA